VIESLDPASSPSAPKQASATPKAAAAAAAAPHVKSFASVHEAAVKREKSTSGPKTTSPRHERMTVPEGETWEATKPGAHYARIVTGPRKGLYINLTHGSRRGQTFTIEQRGGDTLHVYTGTGKEVRVKSSADAAAITDAAKHSKDRHRDAPQKGERWAPVEGHNNYADILGGKRNGLYVNTSGGVRDGMAFQIVKKGGKWWHVYGTGKHRQWIPSDGPKHKPHRSPEVTNGTSGGTKGPSNTPSSGGTSGTKNDTVANSSGGVSAPSAA
jgi:hypothetical protein